MMHSDDTEEWRPVTCAPEFYEVSNFGRVRRATYSVPVLNGSTEPGRLLNTDRNDPRIYDFVVLSCRNRRMQRYVHALVAEAFIGPRPTPQHSVNHIDGDRTNNRASNLEWATPLEQIRHAMQLGRMDPSGTKKYYDQHGTYPQARLTPEIIRVIRGAPARFSIGDLAELFGVDPSHISGIRSRKTWRHLVD